MTKILAMAALLVTLASQVAFSQTSGDVITPPPTRDRGVITPPTAPVDPGIEKAPQTDQTNDGRTTGPSTGNGAAGQGGSSGGLQTAPGAATRPTR
jgi:hypothetical protein